MPKNETPTVVSFADFELDTSTGVLSKAGRPQRLVGQPVLVLEMLLRQPGRVVSADELRQGLWDDQTFVDYDHGLRAAIRRLRVALGDSATSPRFVETLPRRGYRYVGPDPTWSARTGQRPKPVSRWVTRRMALAAAAVAIGVGTWLVASDTTGSDTGRPTIAVLPFQMLTGQADRADLGERLAEGVIHDLSLIDPSRLGVVAHAESRKFGDVTELTYALRTSYILEGALRRRDARLEATVRLIRFRDRTQVWASSFDWPADTEDPQTVAGAIAAALTPILLNGP